MTYLIGKVGIRCDWREKQCQEMAVHEVDVDHVERHVKTPKGPVQLMHQVRQGQVALSQMFDQQLVLKVCVKGRLLVQPIFRTVKVKID